jgi:aspartate/methionine/tyrosine aminotransferase
LSDFQPAARLRGIEKSLIRQVFDRARTGSINLGLGEPDLPTPEVIRQAATRVIREEQNGYTSHAGLPALRERVVSDYPYLEPKPERVIITAGSQEALYLALMTLVDHGDEVLLPDPGFVAYPTIVRMAGGVPRFYRMPATQGFSFDADEFRRALTPHTKVVVCISPSNPTGRTLSSEDLRAMSAALEEANPYVVSDEIYRELYYTPERPATISDFYPRTLVIGGLSKSMSMTGWRVGWLCGMDDAVVRSALVLHGYVTTCASTISQKAALAAWTPDAEQAREQFRERFRKRRDYLLSLVENELHLRAVAPDGAFYSMVGIGSGRSSMAVAEEMLEHGVITVPGVAFGSEGECYLRVSFCADEDKLALGVGRMKSALESFSEKRRKQR